MTLLEQGSLVIDRCRVACAQARLTVARSHALRRRLTIARDEQMWRLAALMSHGSLCRSCLARRSRIDVSSVADVVQRLGSTATIEETVVSCDGCGKVSVVRRLA